MLIMSTNTYVILLVLCTLVAAVVAPIATWLSHLDDPEFEHRD